MIKRKSKYFVEFEDNKLIIKKLYEVQEFDEDGNLILIENYEFDSVFQTTHHTYENGKIIQTIVRDHLGELNQEIQFEYRKGIIHMETEFYNDDQFIEVRYEYDLKGRLKSVIRIDSDNFPLGKVEFKYEDRLNLTTVMHYDGEDFLFEEIKTKLDDAGNEIEIIEKRYGEDICLIKEIINEFNSSNQLLKSEVIYEGEPFEQIENVFDEKDRMVKQLIDDFDKNEKVEYHYVFNDNDLLIQNQIYEKGELTYLVDHEYDEKGEIIKKTESLQVEEDLFEETIYEYVIEYYS